MKNYITTNSILLLLCIFSLGCFTSCSDDDNQQNSGKSETEVVNFVKKYLYNSDNSVKATKIDGYQEGEYALIADTPEEACLFFTQLTGMAAPLTSFYDYQFTDDSCTISIKGRKEAKDGIYATLYIDIPECSEIKVIHIGTPSIISSTNDGADNATSIVRVPVMG